MASEMDELLEQAATLAGELSEDADPAEAVREMVEQATDTFPFVRPLRS